MMTSLAAVLETIETLSEADKQEVWQYLTIHFQAKVAGARTPEMPLKAGSKSIQDQWSEWFEEVDRLEHEPMELTSEYGQALVEKYRKQGLNL